MAELKNKRVFKVGDEELAVVKPAGAVRQKASLVYNRAFREAVRPDDGGKGAIVKASLEGVLREQKLWDDARQAEYARLNAAIAEGEKKLARGRIKLKDAREIAIQMRRDRAALRQLLSDRNSLDLTTAESQAEQAQFNFLVAECTVEARSGKKVWATAEDYDRDGETEKAIKAAREFGSLWYGLDEDWEQKLPENKFLTSYGFARGDGRLVDKDGRLIDAKGRLIDEDGRFVNEKGEYVDADGVPVTREGDYALDFAPFEDDDGNPVPAPAAKEGGGEKPATAV